MRVASGRPQPAIEQRNNPDGNEDRRAVSQPVSDVGAAPQWRNHLTDFDDGAEQGKPTEPGQPVPHWMGRIGEDRQYRKSHDVLELVGRLTRQGRRLGQQRHDEREDEREPEEHDELAAMDGKKAVNAGEKC